MALALNWWVCPDCGTTYSTRIFTCPRCKNTNLERVPMPKITKHMGASVADPELGHDPNPNQPTRGAPGTDLPTAIAPTPHQALPGVEGSQAVSRAPLDSVTESAHLAALTEANGDVTEKDESVDEDAPAGFNDGTADGESIVLARPPVAAFKADWLAYAQQETPDVEGLEVYTKAQLIEYVDLLDASKGDDLT